MADSGTTLICPIRGEVKAKSRSASDLSPSEEALRIDAIRYLIAKGYPADNIKVEAIVRKTGHGGKGTMRADLAVLDVPRASIASGDVNGLLEHARILAEIKRDHAKADYVKDTQVQPLLGFASRADCLALYWDDTEQRLFWRENVGGTFRKKDGPLEWLPQCGEKFAAKPLTLRSIRQKKGEVPLIKAFSGIEDRLHAAGLTDKSRRYEAMLQLLLAKILDEKTHELALDVPLDLQDFGSLGTSPDQALDRFNAVLKKAGDRYGRYLPNAIAPQIRVSGSTLVEIMKILAPVSVLSASANVIQDFYMYFAPKLYTFETAQYFTPTPITKFVIDVLNIKPTEQVKDPACGSADFLTAAYRIGSLRDPDYADYLHGSDNSPEAIQVAVLNMLLQGDGKTKIVEEDSIVEMPHNLDKFDVLVCNPPFGTTISEDRPAMLALYDLGRSWHRSKKAGGWEPGEKMLERQELGILFAELCVRETKPGGRIALIVPNGYLGNTKDSFAFFREWLLRHCRVAAIVSMPETAFTHSGAHVSTSIIYLERRAVALTDSTQDSDYQVAVEIIERLGWDMSKKKAVPSFLRRDEDGSVRYDENNVPMVDSDYAKVLSSIRNSAAARSFGWLADNPATGDGWSFPIADVLADPLRTLDPKRWSRKAAELRKAIAAGPHARLGDIVSFLPERRSVAGQTLRIVPAHTYRYVEIGNVTDDGGYEVEDHLGWDLPNRARHHVEVGDIYVGSIWNSVSRWFYAANEVEDLVATNGFARMRLKKEEDDRLIDLMAALSSEAWAVQMRALARGSNGIGKINVSDMAELLVPIITDQTARAEVAAFVNHIKTGKRTLRDALHVLNPDGALFPVPAGRSHHSVSV